MDLRTEELIRYNKIKSYHDDIEASLLDARQKLVEFKDIIANQEMKILEFQSTGKLVGEILIPIATKRRNYTTNYKANCFIIRSSTGPRYLVTRKDELGFSVSNTISYSDFLATQSKESSSTRDSNTKTSGNEDIPGNARIAMDLTSLIITDSLPRELSPSIFHMLNENPGDVSFEDIGGLKKQLNELREVVELPLINPLIFEKVGIMPAKGVLLYGPPGTGKTLMARAIASNINAKFIKVSASSVMQKYIGESPKMIREIFLHAKECAPCVIFIDEVDAIGGKRQSDASSSDREVQRTLIELLSQMDGFDSLGNVKVMMATNRPDSLDTALLRPGRLDRKIEVPLPNEEGRKHILNIYLKKMKLKHANDEEKEGMVNKIVSLSEGFNGADLNNVATEAAYMAIRADRGYCEEQDLLKGVRKVAEGKKLEKQITYEKA